MGKNAFAFMLAATLLLPVEASAWFFFFIPGQLLGAIGDAVTGSEGANCVSSSAKVGDTIRLPGSTQSTIKSLSGTSSRCTNPEFPVRALVEVSSSPSPTASVAIVSKASINLPDGWESKPLTDQQRAGGTILFAINRTTDTGLLLSAAKREGITDMMTYATSKGAAQASRLKESQQSQVVQISIDGRPAWRFDVTGTVTSGAKFTYLQTIIDAGTEILILNTWSAAAAFDKQRGAMEKLSESISGLTAPTPSIVGTQSATPPENPAPPSTATPVPTVAANPASSIATTPSTSSSPGSTPPQTASPTQRLRELNAVYKEGLIDQTEYEEKKRKILDAM